MARLDNRSINQPVLMFAEPEFSNAGEDQSSSVFDTAQYDAGYTISLNAINIAGGSFDYNIQTSDTAFGGGFENVPADKLIGGALPTMTSALLPGPGAVSVARGVLDGKRFVKVEMTNVSVTGFPGSNVAVFVTLNGAVESAPPLAPEGTMIAL